MSIGTGQVITWNDFTSYILTAITTTCCNVGSSYPSGFPARLKSGQGSVAVKTIPTTSGGSYGHNHGNRWSQQNFNFYANPSNLVSLVSPTTITNSGGTGEWDVFLKNAKIDSRSNKLIQAKDFGLAIGLFMQFLSYHLKPVYAKMKIYATLESVSTYSGTKYVTGTVSPKYQLNGVDPSGTIPEVTNNDITVLTEENFMNRGINWGMFDACYNPVNYRAYLS